LLAILSLAGVFARSSGTKERYLPDPDPAKTMRGAAQWACCVIALAALSPR
jgi:hypothetical protein